MHFNNIVPMALILASTSLAASPFSLDFVKTGVRPSPKMKQLLKSRDTVDAELDNYYAVEYVVNLTVGTPPQHMGAILDTGSSNFWVPATNSSTCLQYGCPFGSFNMNKSSTLTFVNENFEIDYAGGDSDFGDYVTDTVNIGGKILPNMSFGVGQDDDDNIGVLGISLRLNEEGISEPTMIELLKSNGFIDRKAYSLFLNDVNSTTGGILFGGIDTSKYTGDLVALPMQADYYSYVSDFSVALTSVHMTDASGLHAVSFSNYTTVPAVLDSGTWDMQLPFDVGNAIITGMGAVLNESEGYVVPCHYGTRANATFIFELGGPGGINISVPLHQMLSDADYTFEDGSEACSLGVDIADTADGASVILGDSFLRSAYAVFDLENQVVALAQAKYGSGASNVVNIPAGKDLPGVTRTGTATVVSVATGAVQGVPTYNLGSAAGAPTPTATHASSGATRGEVAMLGVVVAAGLGLWEVV